MFGHRKGHGRSGGATSGMQAYGAYDLSVAAGPDGQVAELHLTAPDWVGFEVFVEPDGLSFCVQEGEDVRLRLPLGAGPLVARWTAVGLVVERSDGAHDCEVLPILGHRRL